MATELWLVTSITVSRSRESGHPARQDEIDHAGEQQAVLAAVAQQGGKGAWTPT